jgi:hypothetical protein
MNSLIAVSLLQDDFIFFGRGDIEMLDGKHVIKQLQINKDVIDKPNFQIIKDNLEIVGKCFVDVMNYVEENEKLNVKLSKVGFPIRPLIFYDDLTGMTLLKLFSNHLMYFNNPSEDVYQIVIHPTLVESLPNAKELVYELMTTLLSYNGIKPEDVNLSVYDKYEVYRESKEETDSTNEAKAE